MYSAVGLALIISQSIVAFSIIKYLGAAYLIYIGIQSLRQKGTNQQTIVADKKTSLSARQALRSGFAVNVLNPKATLFFL